MATYAQRAQAISDAIVNGTATQSQINRIGEAIARNSGQAEHYAGLTLAQKAEFIVRHYRTRTLEWVRAADTDAAVIAARAAAATDLPENP